MIREFFKKIYYFFLSIILWKFSSSTNFWSKKYLLLKKNLEYFLQKYKKFK